MRHSESREVEPFPRAAVQRWALRALVTGLLLGSAAALVALSL